MNHRNLQVLIDARELLSDPRKFTQGWFARDVNGVICPATDPRACSYCSYGALRRFKVGHDAPLALQHAAQRVLNENNIIPPIGADSIVHVNDVLGYEAVMKMFALAIDIESGQKDSCDAN